MLRNLVLATVLALVGTAGAPRRWSATLGVASSRPAGEGGDGHFEWPRRCRGWQRRRVKQMLKRTGMSCADFDGCQFDVVGTGGLPALKPWRLATSRSYLAAALRPLRCDGSHRHGHLSGKHATDSGHYTPKFCTFVLHVLVDKDPSHDLVLDRMRPRGHGFHLR